MPLSHVCVWDADIGYKRISLESACKMYPNGASAKSGYFVCELCAQNVLLTAPGVNVRHFRHDPSSPIKSVMSARLISIPYMAGGLEISIAI